MTTGDNTDTTNDPRDHYHIDVTVFGGRKDCTQKTYRIDARNHFLRFLFQYDVCHAMTSRWYGNATAMLHYITILITHSMLESSFYPPRVLLHYDLDEAMIAMHANVLVP